MQLRLRSEPLLEGDKTAQRLYVYKSTFLNKQKQEKLVGTVFVLDPVDENGRRRKPAERLEIEFKAAVSEDEKKEVIEQALEKLPLMDRIWLLRNIAKIENDLKRLEELLSKMQSLPPNCREFEFGKLLSKISRQWKRLQQTGCEDMQDLPQDLKEIADEAVQHPSRQMLWAFHDAGQKATSKVFRQLQAIDEPMKWTGKVPFTTARIQTLLDTKEEKTMPEKNRA